LECAVVAEVTDYFLTGNGDIVDPAFVQLG
jgi:hypothetical protein